MTVMMVTAVMMVMDDEGLWCHWRTTWVKPLARVTWEAVPPHKFAFRPFFVSWEQTACPKMVFYTLPGMLCGEMGMLKRFRRR